MKTQTYSDLVVNDINPITISWNITERCAVQLTKENALDLAKEIWQWLKDDAPGVSTPIWLGDYGRKSKQCIYLNQCPSYEDNYIINIFYGHRPQRVGHIRINHNTLKNFAISLVTRVACNYSDWVMKPEKEVRKIAFLMQPTMTAYGTYITKNGSIPMIDRLPGESFDSAAKRLCKELNIEIPPNMTPMFGISENIPMCIFKAENVKIDTSKVSTINGDDLCFCPKMGLLLARILKT